MSVRGTSYEVGMAKARSSLSTTCSEVLHLQESGRFMPLGDVNSLEMLLGELVTGYIITN